MLLRVKGDGYERASAGNCGRPEPLAAGRILRCFSRHPISNARMTRRHVSRVPKSILRAWPVRSDRAWSTRCVSRSPTAFGEGSTRSSGGACRSPEGRLRKASQTNFLRAPYRSVTCPHVPLRPFGADPQLTGTSEAGVSIDEEPRNWSGSRSAVGGTSPMVEVGPCGSARPI